MILTGTGIPGSQRPPTFTFTVDTNIAGSSGVGKFQLPLVSSLPLNAVVDWGDGTTDTITTFNQGERLHTYASPGVYTIKITGELSGWKFAGAGDRLKMGNVSSWGSLNVSVNEGFLSCPNLTCSATDAPVISTSSLSRYFEGCSNFNGAIGNWNVSGVTNMQQMFQGPGPGTMVFNQDIGGWNTGAVSNMERMFLNASSFNRDIGGWNTGSVSNMAFMFSGASSFNQNIGAWNTGAVTNMSFMFFVASSFNGDIGAWNTGDVQNMQSVFSNATAFNQYIGGWNTGSVTNMQGMFSSASAFNQNIGGWNVGGVSNMRNMFSNASSFNGDIGGWNVVGVTDMRQMFGGATAFDQNIGGWNIRNVTDFNFFMFNKTNLNYSAANLDAIYNGWSTLPVVAGRTISFGTVKFTAAGQAGRDVLTGAPNNWTIADGGI